MKSTVAAVYTSRLRAIALALRGPPAIGAVTDHPYVLKWYGTVSRILLFRYVLCSSRLCVFRHRFVLTEHVLLCEALHVILICRRLRVVLRKRIADLLDRLFSNTGDVLQILGRKIR